MNTPWPDELTLAHSVADAAPPAENSAAQVLWEMGLVLAVPLAAALAIELAFRAF
jgi:hypothetical protein